jgi:hypothetical protein
MFDTAPQPTAPPKSRRRWFRFGLRTLMVGITLLCVWLGVICNRANRQKQAVEAITKAGGLVWYDYQENKEDISFHDASPPGLAWLRNPIGIDYFATVVRVHIDDYDASDDLYAALAELPQLGSVDLWRKGITDSRLACLKGLAQLHGLSVAKSSITNAGWGPLEHLTNLKELMLAGRNVSDSTLSHIEGLTGLTELVLYDTQVTDTGLTHLVRLSRLEQLDLSGSDRITDDGLQHLNGLAHLKLLDVRKTRITVAGIEDLKRVVPNLKVFGP